MRSDQNLIAGPVEGYKIVSDELICRDFQFEIGKRHKLTNSDPLGICKNGFHFCKYPSGVWSYRSTGRMFRVRAYGVLPLPVQSGADYKLVCEEIELYEEATITSGNNNTDNNNTGNNNTGYNNTGYNNTGDYNTGDYNTGYNNTGDNNTGNRNTGNRNTGHGNVGNCHAGFLNCGEAPVYLFDKKITVERPSIPWRLVAELADLLGCDEEIDPTPFLSIPNASTKAIKKLHNAHIAARKKLKI